MKPRMPISKLAAAVFAFAALAPVAVEAQSQVPARQVAPGYPDPYAHDPYITSTGATVAQPGVPQSGPTTPQERAIQRQNNTIDNSICKGC